MMIEVLKSKIHCARVTEANLNYMGSITIDEDLMDAANMIAGEKVYIADNNNGERFETYIIKGERGSGKICLNGAAARKKKRSVGALSNRIAPVTSLVWQGRFFVFGESSPFGRVSYDFFSCSFMAAAAFRPSPIARMTVAPPRTMSPPA